jgi:hypothetical protein
MIYTDRKLQSHVERVTAQMESWPAERRTVCGLLDAYHWFRVSEGEQSLRSAEALRLLLSPELRPALRQWYYDCDENINPIARELRERLSTLAGERFG